MSLFHITLTLLSIFGKFELIHKSQETRAHIFFFFKFIFTKEREYSFLFRIRLKLSVK